MKAHRLTPHVGGFTLIELMIVVAILSILAAISIPKFANLTVKARESSVKSTLTALRSAVSIYYADTEGVFPTDDSGLTPKYIDPIPAITIPPAGNHPLESAFTDTDDDWTTGAWLYVSDRGRVAVNCTHVDTKSSVWSHY